MLMLTLAAKMLNSVNLVVMGRVSLLLPTSTVAAAHDGSSQTKAYSTQTSGISESVSNISSEDI